MPLPAPTALDTFNSFLPELESRAGNLSRRYRDREKAASEALTFMYLVFITAAQRGKHLRPAALAWVARHHLRCRAEVATAPDVKSRSRTVSLDALMDAPDDEAERVGWALSTNERDDPSERVQTKLDWEAFSTTQPPRLQRALRQLAEGYRKSEIARELSISPGRLSQLLDRLGTDVNSFFSEDDAG